MVSSEQPARPGTLYVVATPIGNLRDISLRALDVLRSVDCIAAEDTRVTRVLLAAHGITRPLTALNEHNEARVTPHLIERLKAGDSLALVSDAGTPGISDPGAHLVHTAHSAGVPVIPIPGPSAAITALSIAGIPSPKWLFYGFLPAKAGTRRQALQELVALPFYLVFLEAPHRILDCVSDLAAVFGHERELIIARELTKRFEQLVSLRLGEALAWLSADVDRQRGEFVLIVSGAKPTDVAEPSAVRRVLATLLEELPSSQAARLAAKLTGRKRSELYALARELKPAGDDQP